MISAILLSIWILLFKFTPTENLNIKRNAVSAIHSIACVILCEFGQADTIYELSTAYYSYDLVMQLLQCNVFSISTITLGIHHLVSIESMSYLLSDDDNVTHVFMILFQLVELSNIPVYIMYHWKQTGGKSNADDLPSERKNAITLILLIVEITIYFIFRMVCALYILYSNIHIFDRDMTIIAGILYTISIFWWTSMIKQLKKLV